MTDIIHRLAQWAENDMRAEDIALAAKHEIQNLRAAVAMELLERENQEDLNDILADEVTRLRAALELWHLATKINVTMEGPQYMGVSYILGRQAWERTRDVLEGK
jgi:hypothetical protein